MPVTVATAAPAALETWTFTVTGCPAHPPPVVDTTVVRAAGFTTSVYGVEVSIPVATPPSVLTSVPVAPTWNWACPGAPGVWFQRKVAVAPAATQAVPEPTGVSEPPTPPVTPGS